MLFTNNEKYKSDKCTEKKQNYSRAFIVSRKAHAQLEPMNQAITGKVEREREREMKLLDIRTEMVRKGEESESINRSRCTCLYLIVDC